MPCPCQNTPQPVTNISVNNFNIVDGCFGQTLEMLLVLRDKVACFIRNNTYPNTNEGEAKTYIIYIEEMINNNQVYKYDVLGYYNNIINEQCQ